MSAWISIIVSAVLVVIGWLTNAAYQRGRQASFNSYVTQRLDAQDKKIDNCVQLQEYQECILELKRRMQGFDDMEISAQLAEIKTMLAVVIKNQDAANRKGVAS